jgi:hypothetical protein
MVKEHNMRLLGFKQSIEKWEGGAFMNTQWAVFGILSNVRRITFQILKQYCLLQTEKIEKNKITK